MNTPLLPTDPQSINALPVDALIADIRNYLQTPGNLLLSAAPGAGKTTRVPLALLDAGWLAGQKILLLEPRRLAARNAATFMAQQLGEAVGMTVGYRIRLENRISAATRIEVVTEGILTRMLQDDPELNGVGLVIFDEFHERHLHSDLALALVHQCQQLLRPDLRLLIMSATLDEQALAEPLQAPLLHSEGRSFAVQVHYRPLRDANTRLHSHLVRVIREALQHDGDMLVFLPGVADIRNVSQLLDDSLPAAISVLPLHGQLTDQQQKAALAPSAPGQRRIILATNIAESSLTLDGVRIVIDSGLERRLTFAPQSGMSELKTRAISQASAIQRAGRAGRQAEGVCYRLWPESEQQRREPHIRAEILDSDLSALLLELQQWGAGTEELLWLDPPPAAALSHAETLLTGLGILRDGQLTDHGRACAALGIEPRWAHSLLCAAELNISRPACELIALLQEWPHKLRSSDDVQRLWQQARQNKVLWTQRVQPLAARLQKKLPGSNRAAQTPTADPALLIALAFPDRIARRRAAGSQAFLLSNGSGATLTDETGFAHDPWLAVADLSGGQHGRIRLAAQLSAASLQQLQDIAPQLFTTHNDIRWLESGQFRAEQQTRLGQIVYASRPLPAPSATDWAGIWDDYFATQGLSALNWNEAARTLRRRLQLLHQHQPEQWPDVSDEALTAQRADWLLPFCSSARHQRDLAKIPLTTALLSLLDWEQQQLLEQLTPVHWTVASGSRIAIDYLPDTPVLAVKLQEMFGYEGQPAILNGRLPLLIHLLSPAGRPLQVTADLPHFWRHTYADVRKDMRGRYPRHPWPEDPLSAEATRLTKRALAAGKR